MRLECGIAIGVAWRAYFDLRTGGLVRCVQDVSHKGGAKGKYEELGRSAVAGKLGAALLRRGTGDRYPRWLAGPLVNSGLGVEESLRDARGWYEESCKYLPGGRALRSALLRGRNPHAAGGTPTDTGRPNALPASWVLRPLRDGLHFARVI